MTIERFGVWITDECGIIPSGYGVAWYSHWSHRAFCMRVPFNKVAGACRAAWLSLRRPYQNDPLMLAYRHGHAEGYTQGRDSGFTMGLNVAREAIRVGKWSTDA